MIILPKYELSCIYAITDAIKQLPPEEVKVIPHPDNVTGFIRFVLFGHLEIVLDKKPVYPTNSDILQKSVAFLHLSVRSIDANGNKLPVPREVHEVWQPSLDPDVKAKLVEFPIINLDAKFELLFTKYSGKAKIQNENDLVSCNISALSHDDIKRLISDAAQKVAIVRKETQQHIKLYKLKQQLDGDTLTALNELTRLLTDKMQEPFQL